MAFIFIIIFEKRKTLILETYLLSLCFCRYFMVDNNKIKWCFWYLRKFIIRIWMKRIIQCIAVSLKDLVSPGMGDVKIFSSFLNFSIINPSWSFFINEGYISMSSSALDAYFYLIDYSISIGSDWSIMNR